MLIFYKSYAIYAIKTNDPKEMEFSHERESGTECAVRWEAVLVPDSQNIIENKIACEGC